MRAFSELYEELDSTTGTNAKVEAMTAYFKKVPPSDAAWALFFLSGRRLKRFISSMTLRAWTLELTGIGNWLFEESYSATGDTAECCSLLLDNLERTVASNDTGLTAWMEDRIKPLSKLEEPEQKAQVLSWWASLSTREIYILNKLLTGSFRVGVSQTLVSRSIAEIAGLPAADIAHRLMGDWSPTPEWFTSLIDPKESERPLSRPYPFFLASPIESETSELGTATDWQAERKWDGIRSQLIRREGEIFLWSRGEELITERFPEIEQAGFTLPEGCAIDGEVLAADAEGNILPFAALQKRIGRKKLSKAILTEIPAIIMAYDLLEEDGHDIRALPLEERRRRLEKIIAGSSKTLRISPLVPFTDWAELPKERDKSRDMGVEGLMLKRKSSPYQSGRRRGDWWKWKIDPLTIDAVMIYAQAGSGRRASLFTDYTFALWSGDQLVPIAKAYSGLTDEEINKLDNWIRRHTKEKFGPVRSVEPLHVFELAFEGVALSTRHKSGIAVRFPRILRWRLDKTPKDADNIETLKAMADDYSESRTQSESKATAETAEQDQEEPALPKDKGRKGKVDAGKKTEQLGL